MVFAWYTVIYLLRLFTSEGGMVRPVAAAVKQAVEMPEVVCDRNNRNG